MSTKNRRWKRQVAPPGSSTQGGQDWQPPTDRCKATHDVPYTLRCVLRMDHVWRIVHQSIVQSGEHAGRTVTVYQPHRDKDGREW